MRFGRGMPAVVALTTGLLVFTGAPPAVAGPSDDAVIAAVQQATLTASDPRGGSYFGFSVDVSGTTAVVGALFASTPAGQFAGAAYVFVRSGETWTEQAKLTASDGLAGYPFGGSVAIEGDTVVVSGTGSAGEGGSPGAAYVFVRSGTTWSQQVKLTASDGASGDAFGSSLALSGNTLLVGAAGDDNAAGIDAGAAYAFVRSGATWTQQAKLTAADAIEEDRFGGSVALSGDTALIGSYSGGPIGTGAAYAFQRSGTTWTEQAKLTGQDPQQGDLFGADLALSATTAVIGGYGDDTARGVDSGSATVFVRSGNTWTQQAVLLARDGQANDGFGYSVDISGNRAVVGAYLDSHHNLSAAGSAYRFLRSSGTWSLQVKVTAPDATAGAHFGVSVAIDADTAIAGANFAETTGDDAGAAYVYWKSA
ncbi:MAG: FG-GAP repeat protein [Actinomycetota bacterium]|nr:FG-GAP repeat protein [Actinomycetota bacterium]